MLFKEINKTCILLVIIILPACASQKLIKYSAQGNLSQVQSLLTKGEDVNVQGEVKGETPLYMAARNGHTDIVKVLIAAKADVNARKINGVTPLWAAETATHLSITCMPTPMAGWAWRWRTI